MNKYSLREIEENARTRNEDSNISRKRKKQGQKEKGGMEKFDKRIVIKEEPLQMSDWVAKVVKEKREKKHILII